MKQLAAIFALVFAVSFSVRSQETVRTYLSGIDKDHTVNWDFFINTGQQSGAWTQIAVPSNWELQGFGSYNYHKDLVNPNETGLYRHHFTVPVSGAGRHVFIVFEASMTDTKVEINGHLAGPVHQGGFYRFRYDITKWLHFGGDNLLAVTVSKHSANESVNNAERKGDFWLFGGIFRPVYLETVPGSFIDRVAIDARADGSIRLDVLAAYAGSGVRVQAQVQTLDGRPVGEAFEGAVAEEGAARKGSAAMRETAAMEGRMITLRQRIKSVTAWNPESPRLYRVVVSLVGPKGVIHRVTQRFGFRTVEVRLQDGIYVNDRKVVFKGVCRHSEWPESGRTLSAAISLEDVQLMKEMNMNAVRMSHYPPDEHFLNICDSLGLFVLDELTGWQAMYDTLVGKKLVKELVVRDVNHPSVVIWDNGNEGGWNRALDGEFAKYDPQARWVIHPWERFNGTDTKHYPDYNYIANAVLYGKDIFFPTEFMHGLQDGGHGAGLDDFWSLMRQHPYFAGGFLWSFHDEGVVRTDRGGQIDIQGNQAPDGILGPHREKEGSYYTIREIWSPVVIEQKSIGVPFDGRIGVENRYIYTNLNLCSFTWRMVSLPKPGHGGDGPVVNASGKLDPIDLEPGARGFLHLPVEGGIKKSDVLYLTAWDERLREIFTWSWPLVSPDSVAARWVGGGSMAGGKVSVAADAGSLVVVADSIQYYFDTVTGYLQQVVGPRSVFALSGGPVLAGVHHSLKRLVHYAAGDDYVVEPVYEGPCPFSVQWTFSPGKPARLRYGFSQRGEFDFSGISFHFPEDRITGMEWVGRGPYHVWKNRLKGQAFGVWHKDYNNTVTGESWNYPEFKGYHAEVYWVRVESGKAAMVVHTEDKGMYFQMLTPPKAAGATNENTHPLFPDGELGFLNSISPIGTKFQSAEKMGPQSQRNMQLNGTPLKGTLWFDFR